jgi:hypothetical protein
VSLVGIVGRFWWDFLVGDDWKIAAAVAVTLVAGGLVAASTAAGAAWLAPALGAALLAVFVAALVLDVRRG